MKTQVIAIDGYSSTGKSTVAKRLAKALQYVFIDSGAMYRAVTLFAYENSCFDDKTLNEQKLLDLLNQIHIDFYFDHDTQKSHILLNAKNVEDSIRGMQISERVSAVAKIPEVRKKLVALQRQMSEKHNIIMDGRDIGTVVFPKADIKFFMTASPEERANRRYKELTEKGDNTNYDEVFNNLKERDHIDTTREHSPLQQAEDAILIDNTAISPDEQFELMMTYIQERL